jgi:hypothetical protein
MFIFKIRFSKHLDIEKHKKENDNENRKKNGNNMSPDGPVAQLDAPYLRDGSCFHMSPQRAVNKHCATRVHSVNPIHQPRQCLPNTAHP